MVAARRSRRSERTDRSSVRAASAAAAVAAARRASTVRVTSAISCMSVASTVDAWSARTALWGSRLAVPKLFGDGRAPVRRGAATGIARDRRGAVVLVPEVHRPQGARAERDAMISRPYGLQEGCSDERVT
jgi:hypothetical protein